MEHETADLPGTGGAIKQSVHDFCVDEIPAYLPCGEGDHTFAFVEKIGLTTQDAIAALCRVLGTDRDEVGCAGQKDRHALTRQWLSFPRVAPERLRGLALAVGKGGLRVLSAERHRHKLRTGHLRGNRFVITVRGTEPGVGLARARAVLRALKERGVPNHYGDQRFGSEGKNEDEGRRLLLGELRVADRFRRRFLVSAYQAALFNRYLAARQREGLLRTVIAGDIMEKRDTCGLFHVRPSELDEVQRRLDAGAVAITGPIYGGSMMAPEEGTDAALREQEILSEEGMSIARFARLHSLAEGTRRPLLVPIDLGEEETAVAPHPEDARALVLRFALPKGSYATVVLSEVMKCK